ncbi:MAG: PEP-CTERM sorting domain-containing protein [Candidatus Auribacterota bacterium]
MQKRLLRMVPVMCMILFVSGVSIANAGVLPDRATLESILGANAVTEDFETLAVPSNTAYGIANVDTLDSSTILTINTMPFGPGLVIPGVSFTELDNLNWNGENIWGQTSRAILGFNYDGIPGHSIVIDFHNPTPACGLDLSILSVTPFHPDVFNVAVYGADDSSLLYTSGDINIDFFTRIFWGYTDDAGIGKIAVSSATQDWSAIVDNVTFDGSAVPEPVSSALFVFGAGFLVSYCRKKRSK